MSDVFKVAAVFIGTIVGAGLASGQEILQFFCTYGMHGFWGILACLVLYSLLSCVIVSLCFRHRFRSYSDIVKFAFGDRVGQLVDVALGFFIFSGNVIMLAGGGAMAQEYLGLHRLWGILAMAALSFWVAYHSSRGVIAVNAVIVPISMTLLFLLGFLVLGTSFRNGLQSLDMAALPPKQPFAWTFSAFLYASFNLTAATGVICPLARGFRDRAAFLKGCLLGGLVLCLLSLSICYSILYWMPQSFRYEIPNLYIAMQYGRILPLFLCAVVWLEMLSTEIGNLYSLSSSICSSMKLTNTKALVIILGISVPISLAGFSNLISLLYPAYGVLGLLFVACCCARYVRRQ